jgi:hypothetical protein
MEFLGRISARTVDRDEPADLAARDAQLEAITRWGIPNQSKLARLAFRSSSRHWSRTATMIR